VCLSVRCEDVNGRVTTKMTLRNSKYFRFIGVSHATLVMSVLFYTTQFGVEAKQRPPGAVSSDLPSLASPQTVNAHHLGGVTDGSDVVAAEDLTKSSSTRMMLDKLGTDYNPLWMSIDRPPELDHNVCMAVVFQCVRACHNKVIK